MMRPESVPVDAALSPPGNGDSGLGGRGSSGLSHVTAGQDTYVALATGGVGTSAGSRRADACTTTPATVAVVSADLDAVDDLERSAVMAEGRDLGIADSDGRRYHDLLLKAVGRLTEAARLTWTGTSTDGVVRGRADWAEFVTLALAGAARTWTGSRRCWPADPAPGKPRACGTC
jgi:hypothetical protein